MSFLRRLRGTRRAGPAVKEPVSEVQATDAITRLLVEHGLPALDKQLHLSDLVGDADWLLDQDAGTITFGSEKTCPAQVLGTQSDRGSTWQWAWANPSVPEHVARDAVLVRDYGQQHGIEELIRPQLPLRGMISGEALALISSQLTNADAYYRGPYVGGAVFVLLRLPDDAPRQIDGDLRRAVRTLPAALIGLPVPIGRETVTTYLRWIGLTTQVRGQDLIGRDALGETVAVSFDALGRIGAINSTIGA